MRNRHKTFTIDGGLFHWFWQLRCIDSRHSTLFFYGDWHEYHEEHWDAMFCDRQILAFNNENYNFFDSYCMVWKTPIFHKFTFQVIIEQFVIKDFVIKQFSKPIGQFNKPTTFKLVVKTNQSNWKLQFKATNLNFMTP